MYVYYNRQMAYTPAHAKAMKKYRNKNIELHREITREQVRRHRLKWIDYTHEARRLALINCI